MATSSCESTYPPPTRLRTLGFVIAAVGVGGVVPLLLDRPGAGMVVAVVVLGVALLAVGLHLALVPVQAQVTSEAVVVRYTPFSRTIPARDITEVLIGDRVDGYGFGYGIRLEGRGRWAYRLGAPMVTVVHRGGRIGVSVQDAEAFAAAARRARKFARK